MIRLLYIGCLSKTMTERRHLKRYFITSAFGIGALLSQSSHATIGQELPQTKPIVSHTDNPLLRYSQLKPVSAQEQLSAPLGCENFPGRNTTFFAKGDCPIEVEGTVTLPYFPPSTRNGYWSLVLLERNIDPKGNPILTDNELTNGQPIIWVRGFSKELGVPELKFGQKVSMKTILADYPNWNYTILIPLEIKKLSEEIELPPVPPINVTHYSYLLRLREGLITQFTVLAGNTTKEPLTVFVAGSFDCHANVIAKNPPTAEVNRDNCSVSETFNVDPSSSVMLEYHVSGDGGPFHAFANSKIGPITTKDVLPK